MDQVRERIRTLNDELRRNLPNCHAVITAGIAALGAEAVARIVQTGEKRKNTISGRSKPTTK